MAVVDGSANRPRPTGSKLDIGLFEGVRDRKIVVSQVVALRVIALHECIGRHVDDRVDRGVNGVSFVAVVTAGCHRRQPDQANRYRALHTIDCTTLDGVRSNETRGPSALFHVGRPSVPLG